MGKLSKFIFITTLGYVNAKLPGHFNIQSQSIEELGYSFDSNGRFNYSQINSNFNPTPVKFMRDHEGEEDGHCGECFFLESNQGNVHGSCLTLSTDSCTGFDPESCEFFQFLPHARMKNCLPHTGPNPGWTRQCFYYNEETGQIYDDRDLCFTVMVPDSGDFQDECNPCETMAAGGFPNVGGIVYSWPCVAGGAIYQRWTLDKGLIKSACAHGFYIADAFPFMIVTDIENHFGSFLAKYGDEHDVDADFDGAAAALGGIMVGSTVMTDIGTHGCWCSRLGSTPFLGGHPMDPLDKICRNWVRARRCVTLIDGSCEGIEITGTYTINEDKRECPWSEENETVGDLTCGEAGGHLNSEGCLKDLCLIDLKYITEIKHFLEENISWTPITGDANTCQPGCNGCTGGGGSSTPGPVTEYICVGDSPDVTIEERII